MQRFIVFVIALIALIAISSPASASNCGRVFNSSHPSFTDWSSDALTCIARDTKDLKSDADRRAWDKFRLSYYFNEFFLGDLVGSFKEGPHGVTLRRWCDENIDRIIENTEEILRLARENQASERSIRQLERMVKRLERLNSYTMRMVRGSECSS